MARKYRGPAATAGPSDNYFEGLLNETRGKFVRLLLRTLEGREIIVEGVNEGTHLRGDGVTYPYSTFKVAKFL